LTDSARFTFRGFCALNLGTGCKFGRYRRLRSSGVRLGICHVLYWVFSQDRMPFQAQGVPLAIRLIAVDYALLETVRVSFGALNTSNQGRHIKVILFFRIFPYLDGCCRWYLNVRLLSSSAIRIIMIFSYRHISQVMLSLEISRRGEKNGFLS